MSQQINIRIADELKSELEQVISGKGITLSKFVADAIALSMEVEKNMDKEKHSRLIIENAKNEQPEYKLLLKTA